MKTCIYIDGFNLYFGAVKKTPYKWLNVLNAVKSHLAPHHVISDIKFFTADITPRPSDPDQGVRQSTYYRALNTIPNLQIIKGHFLTKVVRMPLASNPTTTVEVIKTEEKRSDVNLAAHIINDAHNKRFECAVIVSGDSDLLEPLLIVKNELKLPVGVLNPQKHPCVVLKNNATFYKHLLKGRLASNQFPQVMADSMGTFHKPASW